MKTFENDAVTIGSPSNGGVLSSICHLITEQNLGDVRHEVSDVKSDIRESIQGLGLSNSVNFRSLDNRICDAEKSAIGFAKDAIIHSLQSEGRLVHRISEFERNMEKNNAIMAHAIDRGFSKIETDELREELRRERSRRDDDRFHRLHHLVEGIEQIQRQNSKIVQIGAGNLATPVNTNTQTSA